MVVVQMVVVLLVVEVVDTEVLEVMVVVVIVMKMDKEVPVKAALAVGKKSQSPVDDDEGLCSLCRECL